MKVSGHWQVFDLKELVHVVRAQNLARLCVANEDGAPNMGGANDELP